MQHGQLLDVLSWAGLLAFGVSGALVAVQKRFDLVGIIVLTGVTAIGGVPSGMCWWAPARRLASQ